MCTTTKSSGLARWLLVGWLFGWLSAGPLPAAGLPAAWLPKFELASEAISKQYRLLVQDAAQTLIHTIKAYIYYKSQQTKQHMICSFADFAAGTPNDRRT